MLTAVYIVFAVVGFIIFISMLRTKRFFSALILTALQGITALVAANVIGSFIDLHLSLNPHTIILSAVGGTPAVIMLLIADTLFKI